MSFWFSCYSFTVSFSDNETRWSAINCVLENSHAEVESLVHQIIAIFIIGLLRKFKWGYWSVNWSNTTTTFYLKNSKFGQKYIEREMTSRSWRRRRPRTDGCSLCGPQREQQLQYLNPRLVTTTIKWLIDALLLIKITFLFTFYFIHIS